MKLSFTIPGKPEGKARPRFNSFTKRAYTPAQTIAYENKIRKCYQVKYGSTKLDGMVHAVLRVYFDIPKSTSKKDKERMLHYFERPTKKPDCDNIAKIVLDSLNGVAYEDDKQVVSIIVGKWYAEEPRIEVELEEL